VSDGAGADSASGLIPDLWSAADRACEDELRQAIATGELLPALLAIEGADADARAAVEAWLSARAERVKELLAEGESSSVKRVVDALALALGREGGLAGDGGNYYAVDNSKLSRVLARRAGQPILMAAVWMLVGRRAGFAVVGVGLPGHFVVGVEGKIVDAYQGGQFLSLEQCRQIAARALPGRPFDQSWLAPASVQVMVERVLRNLANAHRQAEDDVGAYRALRLLAAIMPADGPVQIELARLTEEHGAWPDALAMLRGIAARFAGRREGQIAELKVMELESRTRVLN